MVVSFRFLGNVDEKLQSAYTIVRTFGKRRAREKFGSGARELGMLACEPFSEQTKSVVNSRKQALS